MPLILNLRLSVVVIQVRCDGSKCQGESFNIPTFEDQAPVIPLIWSRLIACEGLLDATSVL